jgi:hypothetical protein
MPYVKQHRYRGQMLIEDGQVNRDTMSFATKLSHIVYADGTARDVMKTPKTDMGKVLPASEAG